MLDVAKRGDHSLADKVGKGERASDADTNNGNHTSLPSLPPPPSLSNVSSLLVLAGWVLGAVVVDRAATEV